MGEGFFWTVSGVRGSRSNGFGVEGWKLDSMKSWGG